MPGKLSGHLSETPGLYSVCVSQWDHHTPPGPPVLPEPPPDRMIDSSGAAEWKISTVCGVWRCMCLPACLSQTDGGAESLMETEPVRSAIYSPVRSSFSRVHSSCLSTRRQEAKPLHPFPDCFNLSSLRFGKGCVCLNRSPIFNSLIITRFHLSLLFCFSSKRKQRSKT